jgi:hypothetical protein
LQGKIPLSRYAELSRRYGLNVPREHQVNDRIEQKYQANCVHRERLLIGIRTLIERFPRETNRLQFERSDQLASVTKRHCGRKRSEKLLPWLNDFRVVDQNGVRQIEKKVDNAGHDGSQIGSIEEYTDQKALRYCRNRETTKEHQEHTYFAECGHFAIFYNDCQEYGDKVHGHKRSDEPSEPMCAVG